MCWRKLWVETLASKRGVRTQEADTPEVAPERWVT